MQKDKKQLSVPEREEEILKFWEKNRIFEKSLKKNKGKKTFVFYEGPPTANGMPGIHHVEARAFKDAVCRYKTMAGFFVPRRAGWDTHGLPVEIQVEKKLGFKTKQEIENYGIAKFNAEAKKSVWEYKEEWERLTRRMGYWIDMAHPYITYETSYIETLWWIIKQFWEKNLLYEDFKVVPWCPRCQTGLSSHEVGLGYKEDTDTAVYVKFKLKSGQHLGFGSVPDDCFILAWTTTPWTLPGNVALAVSTEIEYEMWRQNGENLIIASDRREAMGITGTVQETSIPGKFLVDLEYEPLFDIPELKKSENAYKIYAADFVSATEGTGVVHTAVMYGEDDYRLGSEVGLPKFHTVGEDGKFKKGIGLGVLEGLDVKAEETTKKILEILGDKIFHQAPYPHEYPHCWRCDTPLLYYARKAWWVKTTAVKDKLLKNNEDITWIPGHLKHGRFGEFLRDVRDWCFSRERYWGTPLPIWKCSNENCVGVEVIGSLVELNKHADRLPRDENGEVNVHRPYVDELTFSCSRCRGTMRRVPEVADVWFDSGAMPFAQTPSRKSYEIGSHRDRGMAFPADYICEGVDQTRGWFYSMLNVATLLGRGSPYKNVISMGILLDKNGEKMSKSKGNIVAPQEMADKYGMDALRWYFFTINAPGDEKRFEEKDVALRQRGFVATFWNSFVFWDTYVKKVQSSKFKVQKTNNILDGWVLAKLNQLVLRVTENLDKYDLVSAARAIDEFTIVDFSQWYVRRSRRRLQRPESAQEKNNAAAVMAEVLASLAELSAPFAPFVSDVVYRGLRKKMELKEESVHLRLWPKSEVGGRRSEVGITEEMEAVREIVAEALKLRAAAGIKVRQPLAKLQITNDKLRRQAELLDLIKDEVNVKEIVFGDETDLDTEMTPELREGGFIREFIRNIQEKRRELGLSPIDRRVLRIENGFDGDDRTFLDIVRSNKETIIKETGMSAIYFSEQGKSGTPMRGVLFEEKVVLFFGIADR